MDKKCEVCGIQFNATKSRIRTCSRQCGGIIRRRTREPVAMVCVVCGTGYDADAVRLGFRRQTTCSRACSYILRGQGNTEPRVESLCGLCGKQISRTAGRIKAKHRTNFCSRACHFAGRALRIYRPDKYRHTHDGIVAQRKTGALAYASGTSIQWPEIENDIAGALRDAGHVVIQQHIVSDGEHFWPVDIFVPAMLVVVEIDGAEHRQAGTAERDRLVDAHCAGLGLRVIRIPDGEPCDVRQAVFTALAGLSV